MQTTIAERNPLANALPTPKRIMDLAVSICLLVVLLPLMALLIAIARRDGGPAFYAHRRVGLNGREFGCLKFRSMLTNGDEILESYLASNPIARQQWQESHKLNDDPRITRIGRWLRKTSMDELPQLINVIRGEMSMVGPRPVTKDELDQHYGSSAAGYLSVRPGITRPWQIGGRSDTTYQQRVEMDSEYACHDDLLRDIGILIRTPFAVFSCRGAR